MILKSSRTATGARLLEHHFELGTYMHEHEHLDARLELLFNGAYTEKGTSGECSRSGSAAILRPPAEKHEVRFLANTHILRIELDSSWIKHHQLPANFFECEQQTQSGQSKILGVHLLSEFRFNDESSTLAIDGLLLQFFAQFQRDDQRGSQQYCQAMRRVMEILKDKFPDPLTIKEIAQEAGLHPVELGRKFQKAFGCNPGAYVRRLRVEYVARQLRDTEKSVSRIAAEAGYYDQSHCCNTFHRFFGITPSGYRRSCKL
jgi:AraC family transcriptional regulator